MRQYKAIEVQAKAKELHAVRNTFEKVLRLSDILSILDLEDIFQNNFALKGGTALNLFYHNLPRLSVDIDLDCVTNYSSEELLCFRESVSKHLLNIMSEEGFTYCDKSKFSHSLDSFVFKYENLSGVNDIIKIELNYSLRSHILPIERKPIIITDFHENCFVNLINQIEIYATKIVALLTRGAARDLFDVYTMS